MMESVLKRIERNRKERDRWIALVLCLSMIVSLGVFSGLRMDAIAKTYTRVVLECPYMEEGAERVVHTHNADCYDEYGNLACTLPELEAHTHSDACCLENTTLVCGLEENPGHRHTDDCYTAVTTLVCDLEENEGHQHTGDCYTLERGELLCDNTDEEHEHTDDCYVWNEVLSCGMEAGEGAHLHSEDCYRTEWILTCGMEEGEGAHTHTDECYLTDRVLICDKPEIVLHTHTDDCYQKNDDGSIYVDEDGYAWLICGQPEIIEHVHDADCFAVYELDDGEPEEISVTDEIAEPLTEDTDEAEPAATEEHEEADDADAAEEESETEETDNLTDSEETKDEAKDETKDNTKDDTEDENEEETESTDTEADVPAIPMPAQSFEKLAGGIRVSVEAPEGAFPENTRMSASPVNGNSLKNTVSDAINGEVLEVQAVDIKFYDAEGNEIEPATPIRVSLTPWASAHVDQTTQVVHIDKAGDAEVIEQAADAEPASEREVVFDADSFSIYAIVYSVSFEYEVDGQVFTSSVPGAREIMLSDVLKELNITAEDKIADFMSRIADVSVSAADVLSVTAAEADWTICALKASEDVAFLTVTMQDGAVFSIAVKADGATEVSSENEIAVISTVNDRYLPDDATARAEVLDEEKSESAIAAVQQAAAPAAVEEQEYTAGVADAGTKYQVFSIGLENVDATAYEGFNVSVTLPEDAVVGKDFQLYQIREDETVNLTESLEVTGEPNENGLQNVSGFTFKTDDFADFVLSYSIETNYTAFDGKTFKISLNYGPEAEIPEGAALKVEEILPETESYAQYLNDSVTELGVKSGAVSFARFFDIEIQKDGEKIEPQAPVSVTIQMMDLPEETGNAEAQVIHFGEQTEVLTAEAAGTDVSFETGSFSVYGVVYTVDFHYEVNGQTFEFSIPGGGFISLEHLIEVLGINVSDAAGTDSATDEAFEEEYTDNSAETAAEETAADPAAEVEAAATAAFEKAISLNNVPVSEETRAFVAEIAAVEFSSPELMWTGKVEEESTVDALKEANGLEVEYSANLTEEQIAEINAQTVEAGDWALVSILPFDTEESLTVTMKNGDQWTVKVTDARDPLGLDGRSFAMVNETNDETLAVQSKIAWSDLGGRVVTCTTESGTEYCAPEATAWKFVYDPDNSDEENGVYRYYISAAEYHGDSDEELYLNIGGTSLLVSKTNASSMRVEKDETGNFRISDGDGHYLKRNNDYMTLNSFSTVGSDPEETYAQFRFCLPEEVGSNASHKAMLISAADTQPGQKIIIYQRVLQSDDTFKYYAIDGDGELVEVFNSSDSVYWKGNPTIEWTLEELGNGYYTLYNESTGTYLTPKSDDIVHNAWDLDFEGEAKHLSISLPGRESGAYTSQIASWDYNANVTYGLKVSNSGSNPTIGPQDLLSSQYFYFAARDPIVHDQLTTVDTVDSVSKGITIKMYDWGNATGTDAAHDSYNWDAYSGNDKKIQTRYNWMQTIMGNGSDSYTARVLQQGLASRTLDPGTEFPNATKADSNGTIHNLSELFSDQYLTSSNANHLFLQSVYDETGFFKYSSFENYAYLGSGNDFTVYEQIGTPSTRGTNDPANGDYTSINNPADYLKVFMRGNFMPYNEINSSMTYRFNEYDPDMNALSENDPRRNERLYFIENANPNWSPNPEASANYFFGMTVEAKFTQNPGGYADNGDPMVFEFNGDDDMWVYIDNVLVLDVGGVHDAFRGRINFRTGDVNVFIAGNGTINNTQSGVNDYNTTIKEMFWKAHRFPDGSEWTNYNDSRVDDYFSGNTFKDYSTHDFKMIYMERGASASNLEMQFNLPVLTSSQFRVKKEMPETVTGQHIQNEYADAAFYYKAYVKVNGKFVPVTKNYLNTWLANSIENPTDRVPTYEDGSPVVWVGSNGQESNTGDETVFEVKPGNTACFPALDDSVEWYVVEVEPEDNAWMLASFDVRNTDEDRSGVSDPDIRDYREINPNDNHTRYQKSNVKTIGTRNIVSYTNKPDDTLVNDLQIKKKILGDPYHETDAFEYRILLESTHGEMVAYRLGEYYQIDAQGRYIYYENGERQIQSENPEGPYTYTLDGQTVTSDKPRYAEHTSTNGSLGDVRDGDTIIIKGLFEGTEFYVYERTSYDYMSDNGTLIYGKYVFENAEVTDAANRKTHENWPEHATGSLFDEPKGLNELLAFYNASDYERSKAADGIIVQEKDAKVLVTNRPCGRISVEKKWLDENGDPLTDHPDSITYTVYQLKHEHEWAAYTEGEWDYSQSAGGDGWVVISYDGHTRIEKRKCRFEYCDHCEETRTIIAPCEEHQWSEWERTSEPTCTASGLERRTCSVCGAVETRTVTKLGHDWNIIGGVEQWIVTKEPSCTEAGVATITCRRCGKTIDRPHGTPLGHDYVETITTQATCTEEGVKSLSCSRCGDSVSDQPIPALGHDLGEWHDNTATCTAGGTEHRDCSRCDYTESRETDPLGHDYVWTSNGDGTETGVCSRCGDTQTRTQQNLFPGTTDLVLDDFTWPTGGGDVNCSGIYKYGDEYWVNVKNYGPIDSGNASNGPSGVESWGVTVKMNKVIRNVSDIYGNSTGNIHANVQKGTLVRGTDGSYYVRTNNNEWSSAPNSTSTPDGDGWYKLPAAAGSNQSTLSTGRSLSRGTLMRNAAQTDSTTDEQIQQEDEENTDRSGATVNNESKNGKEETASTPVYASVGEIATGTDGMLRTQGSLRNAVSMPLNLTESMLLEALGLEALNTKNSESGNTLTMFSEGMTLTTTTATLVEGEDNLWNTDIMVPEAEDDSMEYRYYVVETNPEANGEYTVTYSGQDDGLVPTGSGSHVVRITNQLKPKTCSVQVTKSFSGIDSLTSGFQITNDYNSAVFTVENAASGDGSAASPYTWTITDVPLNKTVIFTESGILVNGYSLTVNSVATTVDSATVQAVATSTTETASASLVNDYSKNPGDLELTKKVAGNGAETSKEFAFTISLTAPAGGTLAESYKYTKTGVSGEQTLNLTCTDSNTKATITGIYLKANDVYTIKGLPAGTVYEITEADYSAYGYISSVTSGSLTGTITGGTTAKESVEVTNTLYMYNLKIVKVEKGTTKPLAGAKFHLTRKLPGENSFTKFEHPQFEVEVANGNKRTGPFEVESNGEIILTGLLPGSYRLQEVQAPAGYIITMGAFEFSISSDGSLSPTGDPPELIAYIHAANTDPAGYQIGNEPGTPLPMTGGIGTNLFTVIGGILSATAGAILTLTSYRRRKKQYT